jgi:hypothetical protein
MTQPVIRPTKEPELVLGTDPFLHRETIVLNKIRMFWESKLKDSYWSPFQTANTEVSYIGKCFELHGHDWNDNPRPYNFVWRDVAFYWYKHFPRGLAISRKMTEGEMEEMLDEVVAEITSILETQKHFTAPAPQAKSAEESAAGIFRTQTKISNNSMHGSHAKLRGHFNKELHDAITGNFHGHEDSLDAGDDQGLPGPRF